MTENESARRKALLATLFFWAIATPFKLRQEMESVHGIVASADLIRADLDWLAEMGLIRWNGEAAQCNERGRDVAALRAKFPGES